MTAAEFIPLVSDGYGPMIETRMEIGAAMENFDDARKASKAAGFRLVRIIIIETLLVAFVGLLIWGVAWDLGYPTAGLVIAIVVWLTVSPVVEIATVMNYRKSVETGRGSDQR